MIIIFFAFFLKLDPDLNYLIRIHLTRLCCIIFGAACAMCIILGLDLAHYRYRYMVPYNDHHASAAAWRGEGMFLGQSALFILPTLLMPLSPHPSPPPLHQRDGPGELFGEVYFSSN